MSFARNGGAMMNKIGRRLVSYRNKRTFHDRKVY